MKTALSYTVYLVILIGSVHSKKERNYTEIASNDEIESIGQELFNLDDTHLLPYIVVNYQGQHVMYNSTEDLAPEPLLTLKDEFTETETMKLMQMMYDNYERNSSVDETVTNEEINEENNFVDSLLKTAVMRRAMNFLEEKNLVENNTEAHHNLLKNIWFGHYPRNKKANATSSGFEHVFLVESKRNKLIGLHNWIYFAEMEKSGNLNYKGWERIVDLGDKAKIIKLKFDINGMRKTISSIFLGTSPELEFALYTVCFKLRANRNCQLTFDDVKFNVTTYSMSHKRQRYIGTAYVSI